MPRPKRDQLPPGITRRPSGGYQAQAWSVVERRRTSRTFLTLAQAKAWKRDTEQAYARGVRTGAAAPRLRDYATGWLADAESGVRRTRSGEVYRPSTLRGYRQALDDVLLPALGPKRLSEIRRGELHRLVQRLTREGRKPSTVRNVLLPLRAIFRDAMAAEVVHWNPCTGLALPVERGRRERVIAPGEATVMLATLADRDRALWATAMYAGLRRGELMALRWAEVDLMAGRLRVERSYDPVARTFGPPKSRAGLRVIPVPAVLRDQLQAHRDRADEKHQPLVFARSTLAGRRRGPDGPFNDAAVMARARKALEDQGILPASLHVFRHTYGTLLIAAGETAKAVQTYMGHSSITITFDRYGHLFPAAEDASAAALQTYLDAAKAERDAAEDAASDSAAPAGIDRTAS
jgi:integrase